MPNRGHNILEGMGELLLSLVWNHASSEQWTAWLKTILLAAATEGDADMVSALLQAGASSFKQPVNDNWTPLHAAALGGSLDVVESLLKNDRSSDVDKQVSSTGQTPLYVAVQHGHADVALALARGGGDVRLADSRGWSPLIRAAFDGRAELVTDLLVCGSQVDALDKDGDQALHYAVRQGHVDVVRVLLQARACPDTRGKENMSAFDLAVKREDINTLLELIAMIDVVYDLDDAGERAMWIAVRNGHSEAIGMLFDAGARLAYGGEDRLHPPLHVACLFLQAGSVQTLLHRNADENECNDSNELPHELLGHGIPEEERDNDVVADIHKMLARAPADRGWRRRGWLAMLNARVRSTDTEHRMVDHEGEARNKQHDEGEPASVRRSRRKLAGGRKWATGDAVHVHPTRKKFHWVVTMMVDVADELVFRNIVSYL